MIRIATFNIENLDNTEDEQNPQLSIRAPFLRATLKRLDADIICFQEVHGQELPNHTSNNPKRDLSALDFVLQGTQYINYERAHTLTSANVPYNERNLVIISRYPIVQINQYRNNLISKLKYRKVTASPSETAAKDVIWERPILHAKINVPNLVTLHVINLHLKSRLASKIAGQQDGYLWNSAAGWAEGYFLSSLKRVGQALETRILVDIILENEPDGYVLVCGDFNAEPGEVPVEAICGRVENTNNPDLRSKVLIPCSNRIADSVRYSHLHHGHGNLLDHMLMSQALLQCFSNAEIHNENLHDESLPFTFDTKYPESDHAAFLAEFSIQE